MEPEDTRDVPLTQQQIRVLRESLWHSVQRADVSQEDLSTMVQLRLTLAEYIEE